MHNLTTLQDSEYWTQLNATQPFDFMSSRLWNEGISPTQIRLKSNRELVFEYRYQGTGSKVSLEATWDFRWNKFYFIQKTQAPLHFRVPDFVDSPFMTEQEFLSEIDNLESNADFDRIEGGQFDLQQDDIHFIASRFKS